MFSWFKLNNLLTFSKVVQNNLQEIWRIIFLEYLCLFVALFEFSFLSKGKIKWFPAINVSISFGWKLSSLTMRNLFLTCEPLCWSGPKLSKWDTTVCAPPNRLYFHKKFPFGVHQTTTNVPFLELAFIVQIEIWLFDFYFNLAWYLDWDLHMWHHRVALPIFP